VRLSDCRVRQQLNHPPAHARRQDHQQKKVIALRISAIDPFQLWTPVG
jgi:hypothetical protein